MSETIRKALSMLLLCAIFFSNVGMDAYASEISSYKTGQFNQQHINPLYEDVYDEDDFKSSTPEYGIATYAAPEYLADEREIAKILREAMLLREETVVVYYTQVGELRDEILSDWVNMAVEHTDDPEAGDYLRCHYASCSAQFSWRTYANDVRKYTVTITLKYHTSLEQENAVDAAVKELLAELGISDELSDYEKLTRIYDYICENVVYDYENLEDPEYKLKYSAYAALINKTAVCQGYASLLYRMLKEAGVETRIIRGTANGGGHAWNIVKLGSKYYNLDATWDAVRLNNYRYFLRGSEMFTDHVSDEEYLTDEFVNTYPISKTDYTGEETIENPFTDVSEYHYYYKPVLWALENKVTAGVTATQFGAESVCTRGQVVTFLWRANGCPNPTITENPFSDVKNNDYYYKAVLWALESGITAGVTDTRFGAGEECTRGQVVTFLWRAAGKTMAQDTVCRFEDVNTGSYYRSAILWAVEQGITQGKSSTEFGPEDTCTRGQVVAFLYRHYR